MLVGRDRNIQFIDMASGCIAMLLLSMLIIDLIEARSECVKAIGRVECRAAPSMASRVLIELRDRDGGLLPMDSDDLMGRTWSTENGSFELSGCGSDFGFWNGPDPYVHVEHACPSTWSSREKKGEKRTTQFFVWPMFVPQILDMGKISLDDESSTSN